ncbi:MAG: NAD-dependent dehydratase [Geobacter sp.]|nr:MAG: NAD-dependent dehydratase [Geobacter sp.]
MKVLITGATGFVGHFTCSRLLREGAEVRGTLLATESPAALTASVSPAVINPLEHENDWSGALRGIDVVVHLAARVHVMQDRAEDPLGQFRKVNTEGTRQLARQSAKAGVKRLLFISTIKVNGEESAQPYTEESPAHPTDPYGISKWEAEQALRQIEAETGMEVVIVRPTLVYGPGVKANFLSMMNAVRRGIPLPLASITNKRSMIYVGNLADALATCATHPAAGGKTFLVSDGVDVSTPELIRRTASALGVTSRLFPFPLSLMRLAGKISGRNAVIDRITGSLAVDSSKIKRELGWMPPFTMEAGLRETAAWYLKTNGLAL